MLKELVTEAHLLSDYIYINVQNKNLYRFYFIYSDREEINDC